MFWLYIAGPICRLFKEEVGLELCEKAQRVAGNLNWQTCLHIDQCNRSPMSYGTALGGSGGETVLFDCESKVVYVCHLDSGWVCAPFGKWPHYIRKWDGNRHAIFAW